MWSFSESCIKHLLFKCLWISRLTTSCNYLVRKEKKESKVGIVQKFVRLIHSFLVTRSCQSEDNWQTYFWLREYKTMDTKITSVVEFLLLCTKLVGVYSSWFLFYWVHSARAGTSTDCFGQFVVKGSLQLLTFQIFELKFWIQYFSIVLF